MTNGQDPVVEQALNDCAGEFVNGVQSYSNLEIKDGVIADLKRALRGKFTERLAGEPPEKWQQEKGYVAPMGFYTGALAACYAHNIDKVVTKDQARRAIEHVAEECRGPVRGATEATVRDGDDPGVRWFYCPEDWPWSGGGV